VDRSAIVFGTSVDWNVLGVPTGAPTPAANVRVHEPSAAVAVIANSMVDPQDRPVPTVYANEGVLLGATPFGGMLGYVAADRVTVTPGVLVETTAVTAVRFTVPLFLRDAVRTTSSPGSTVPFAPPVPPAEHESADALDAKTKEGPHIVDWHSSGT
jgi:hypothetical protein